MKSLRRDILAHAAVLALCLGVVLPVPAQSPFKKSKGPRAMGLLQWKTASGQPTLIPITLWINRQYQDASIYMADPVPMALDSGIVYEGYKAGVSQGLFNIRAAQQRKENWVAVGSWTSNATIAARTKQRDKSEETVKAAEEKADERPVLRRNPAPPPSDETQPPAQPPVPSSSGIPPPQTPASPSQPTPVATSEVAVPSDSDRPILKRGQPAQEQASSIPEPAAASHAAKLGTAQPAGTASTPIGTPVKELVAISDATTNDTHDWKYGFSSEEERNWAAAITQLAQREVAASETLRAKASLPVFADVQFHAFDLDLNNESELVFTGRIASHPAVGAIRGHTARAAIPETYVTIVARIDLDNNLRRIYSSVTDADHLDVVGRMEFLDAVDADGDGHAELLFRRVTPDGYSFQLYRAGADQLWKLYDSAHE